MTLGREIVVLVDHDSGLEITGRHAEMATNFQHAQVTDVAAALAFAARIDFPAHGVIVMACIDRAPAPKHFIRKSIETAAELSVAVTEVIATCGAAHVETDMRAHRNPMRMRAIKRAAIDLVRRFRSACPRCARPGFAMAELLRGLPCAGCGGPSIAVRAEIWGCDGCGHREEKPARAFKADPSLCPVCNP